MGNVITSFYEGFLNIMLLLRKHVPSVNNPTQKTNSIRIYLCCFSSNFSNMVKTLIDYTLVQ